MLDHLTSIQRATILHFKLFKAENLVQYYIATVEPSNNGHSGTGLLSVICIIVSCMNQELVRASNANAAMCKVAH